jgi:hypothetical protein
VHRLVHGQGHDGLSESVQVGNGEKHGV